MPDTWNPCSFISIGTLSVENNLQNLNHINIEMNLIHSSLRQCQVFVSIVFHYQHSISSTPPVFYVYLFWWSFKVENLRVKGMREGALNSFVKMD